MRHPYNLDESMELSERLNLIESFEQRLFIFLISLVLSGYFIAAEITKSDMSRPSTTHRYTARPVRIRSKK